MARPERQAKQIAGAMFHAKSWLRSRIPGISD
jgi:hypothetical protein